MQLQKILKNVNYELISGSLKINIKDITYNSKEANKNNCFIALVGIDHDGHDYIEDAISLGCHTFIVSKDIDITNKSITVIKVANTRKILPIISANLFDNPADKLIKIAITGTKGKTTISYILKQILENANKAVGVIGTNGTTFLNKHISHKNTTPESYLIEKYMKMMVDAGVEYLVMEVSSQALKVGRVSNIIFDYAIFTNLSLDHVGVREHPSYEDYVYSKSLLFSQSKIGIINRDDMEFNNIVKDATAKIITYGKNKSDYLINNISKSTSKESIGMKFKLNDESYYIGLPGEFSVYNATSAIILSKLLNIKDEIIHKSLKKINIEGRMEIIPLDNYKIVIDFAHNNLSIESIIKTMKDYGKYIVTIIGCGGGRSRDIRVGLGRTVGSLSDFTIITADNPRNDNLDEINTDIKKGIDEVSGKSIIIPNREDAIKYAMTKIPNKDIILLLGKGHEKYQEIKNKRYYFNEREIVQKIIKEEK